jgi:hypothetical protein
MRTCWAKIENRKRGRLIAQRTRNNQATRHAPRGHRTKYPSLCARSRQPNHGPERRPKTVVFLQNNNPAGKEALALLADLGEPKGLQVGTMAYIYPQPKDVNEYWMYAARRQPLGEQTSSFATLKPVGRHYTHGHLDSRTI